MSIRDEIRQLCIAHDRFMAEQASEPIRRPPVSETEDVDGLVYKTTETPLPAAPQPDSDASDADLEHDDWRTEVAQALGEVAFFIKRECRQERDAALIERDRRISTLEGEVRELKGFIGGVVALLGGDKKVGQKSHDDSVDAAHLGHDGSVVDLPDWRRSHGAS